VPPVWGLTFLMSLGTGASFMRAQPVASAR
jgi:hypothetical protein